MDPEWRLELAAPACMARWQVPGKVSGDASGTGNATPLDVCAAHAGVPRTGVPPESEGSCAVSGVHLGLRWLSSGGRLGMVGSWDGAAGGYPGPAPSFLVRLLRLRDQCQQSTRCWPSTPILPLHPRP